MLSETAKKDIISTYLGSISDVANREYQNRVWIKGLGPECDDYGEFINYFLPESTAILNNYKDFGIRDDQYLLLTNFTNAVDHFNLSQKDTWPQRFLRSPKWKKIMGMASEILKAFGQELPTVTKDKEKIIRNFLQNIAHAADEQYQERVWIQKLGPEQDSFGKFINQFYYEGDDILENYKDFGVTAEQRLLLTNLSKAIDSFYEPFPSMIPATVFLRTPEWKKIVQMAQEVLRAFNYPQPITGGLG